MVAAPVWLTPALRRACPWFFFGEQFVLANRDGAGSDAVARLAKLVGAEFCCCCAVGFDQVFARPFPRL